MNFMRSTYTFSMLKENILKVLGEYSLNGTENPAAGGFLADVEKRFISVLNICLRRVTLNLPLLEKKADLQFFWNKAELPDDFGKVNSLFVTDLGYISESGYRINGNMLECPSVDNEEFAVLTYKVIPKAFTPDMSSDAPVLLPDITVDALCYLTAAELCPAEYGELYSKLMYKYRDICMNYYNCEGKNGNRNTFFNGTSRRFKGGKTEG